MKTVKQWLSVILDEKKSIAILEPHGPLSENDFKEASEQIDSFLEKNERLNWIIIYAKSFPYWETFSWLLSHLKFIRNHQKKVVYLAFVTDSTAWVLAEKIWDYFVKAKIKNFDSNELEVAKEWIISDQDWIIEHKLYVDIDSLEKSWYVELKIIWTLTHEDYQKAMPLLDKALDKINNKKWNILVDMSDFEGWELKAAWDDFKFWMKHDFDFWKIAIFWNEKKWLEYSMKITSWFMKWKIKSFNTKKESIEWLK